MLGWQQEMAFKERVRWIGQLFLLLFVLGSAAFLSAITAMRFAIEGRLVTMPALVGRPFSDAAAELRLRGLEPLIADHVYSSLPEGAVVRQNPPPGVQVKVGQRVQLVLSLGPQKVAVPQLVDMTLRAAQLRLLALGLQLGEVSYLYTTQEPAGFVIQQDPPAGTTELSHPRVSLLVSQGPQPTRFLMPDFTGQKAAEVQAQLGAAGFAVRLEPTPTEAAEPGTVIGQQPAAGSQLVAGTVVVLRVATKTAPAQVPGPPPNREGFLSSVLQSAAGTNGA